MNVNPNQNATNSISTTPNERERSAAEGMIVRGVRHGVDMLSTGMHSLINSSTLQYIVASGIQAMGELVTPMAISADGVSHSFIAGLKDIALRKNKIITQEQHMLEFRELKEVIETMEKGSAIISSCGHNGHMAITFFTENQVYCTTGVLTPDSFDLHVNDASSGDPRNLNVAYDAAFHHQNAATLYRNYISILDGDSMAIINGLDTERMLDFVLKHSKEFKYHVYTNNCSRYVADIILAGVPLNKKRAFVHDRKLQMPLNTMRLAREVAHALSAQNE